MTIKELQKIAHKDSVSKGFWGTIASELGADSSLKNKRNLSELLMLIVTELGEACEALRKDNRQSFGLDGDEVVTTEELFDVTKNINHGKWTKDTFEDELADAMIRICDLAESEGIDLEWQIQKKLEYNKTRPKKHGKKF